MGYHEFNKGKAVQRTIRDIIAWLLMGWLFIPLIAMIPLYIITISTGINAMGIIKISSYFYQVWFFIVPALYIFKRNWVIGFLDFFKGLTDGISKVFIDDDED